MNAIIAHPKCPWLAECERDKGAVRENARERTKRLKWKLMRLHLLDWRFASINRMQIVSNAVAQQKRKSQRNSNITGGWYARPVCNAFLSQFFFYSHHLFPSDLRVRSCHKLIKLLKSRSNLMKLTKEYARSCINPLVRLRHTHTQCMHITHSAQTIHFMSIFSFCLRLHVGSLALRIAFVLPSHSLSLRFSCTASTRSAISGRLRSTKCNSNCGCFV